MTRPPLFDPRARIQPKKSNGQNVRLQSNPQNATLGEQPNEATDDPHRLAREFINAECTNEAGELTLVFWRDEFHEYNGICYRSVPTPEIKARLGTFIKKRFDAENVFLSQHPDMWKNGKPPNCRKVTVAVVNNVFAALQGMMLLAGHHSTPLWLDGSRAVDPADIISTRSGLLVLPRITEADHLLKPTANLFTPNGVNYEYNPLAECPAWLQFLNSLWPDDLESIQTLQDWIGYLLLPDSRMHKMLMLIGPPRGGKGTIVRMITKLIGENNLTFPKLASFSGPFGLQPLLNKTVAIVTDARLSARTDSIQVVEHLLSISGEDPQDVHRKNLPTITGVRLPVRFMIMTNELPNVRESSGAFTSRVILLRLSRSFLGAEDKTLDARLAAELPGILNWALVGWLGVRERGTLIQPESGRELLADLDDLASPMKQFIRERCFVGPQFSVRASELFKAWETWCQDHGRINAGHDGLFGKDIRAALPGVKRSQPRFGEERIPHYTGVGLL